MTHTYLTDVRADAFAHVAKVLADPHRLRILGVISAAGPTGICVCVCDIVAEFTINQSTVSHHLKRLRESGFVTSERRGSEFYYSTVPGAFTSIRRLVDVLDPVHCSGCQEACGRATSSGPDRGRRSGRCR